MSVRLKIALWITASGFLSSLVFSGIVLWEMMEQPFHLMDTELETVAKRVAQALPITETQKNTMLPLPIGDERIWLKLYDQQTARCVYRSDLAGKIDIEEPPLNTSATIRLVPPPAYQDHQTGDEEQHEPEEMTFRVRKATFTWNGKTYLFYAARPLENFEEEIEDILGGVLGGLALSVVVLLGVSYVVAGIMLKPIRIMNEQARDISEKHLDRRIPTPGDQDEFSKLAKTLNQVFDRLEHAFDRQKRFLADASHEMKTPLTMMRLSMDEIRRLTPANSAPLQRNLDRMTEQVFRMQRLIQSILDLSALEIERSIPDHAVDIGGLLEALIQDYLLLATSIGVRIVSRPSEGIFSKGDPEQLKRAFSNLIDNAIKYNFKGGRVDITAVQSPSNAVIAITNTGPGIPEDEIPRVFDQFYRVEASRATRYGGSGLGLTIVRRIIESHGGDILIERLSEGRTRVIVRLPLVGRA